MFCMCISAQPEESTPGFCFRVHFYCRGSKTKRFKIEGKIGAVSYALVTWECDAFCMYHYTAEPPKHSSLRRALSEFILPISKAFCALSVPSLSQITVGECASPLCSHVFKWNFVWFSHSDTCIDRNFTVWVFWEDFPLGKGTEILWTCEPNAFSLDGIRPLHPPHPVPGEDAVRLVFLVTNQKPRCHEKMAQPDVQYVSRVFQQSMRFCAFDKLLSFWDAYCTSKNACNLFETPNLLPIKYKMPLGMYFTAC